jgi:hypothetical protein
VEGRKNVKTLLRTMMALAAVVALAWAAHWASHRFGGGMSASSGHEAVLHAPGTVVSVTAISSGKDGVESATRARVCFSIDSFSEIDEERRELYEIHEHARAAADGPLCRTAIVPAETPTPEAGDRLDVYFTLQEGGGIEPVKLIRKGVEIQVQ